MKTKSKRRLLVLPFLFLSSVLASACSDKTPSSSSNTSDGSEQNVNKTNGTSSQPGSSNMNEHDPTVKAPNEQKN